MTDYTNNFSLPYPEGGNSVAVHSDIEVLAKRTDTEIQGVAARSFLVQDVLATGTDLDTVRAFGMHRIAASQPVVNGPAGWEGLSYGLEVLPYGRGWTQQRATNTDTGQTAVRRLQQFQVTDWLFGPEPILLDTDTDLNALRIPGPYRAVASQPVVNGPPGDGSFALEVLTVGRTWTMHRASTGEGLTWERRVGGPGGWSNWVAASGAGTGTAGQARTAMENTGDWTTSPQETQYLDSLAHHRQIHHFTVGTTVEGRTINGIRLGNPNHPAVLLLAGQHGDEPGTREGAMIFAREMAQAQTLALMDLCVIIVPTLNTDRVLVRRTNANNIDTNRDWEDLTQPETQAIDQLLHEYNVVAAVDAHNGGHRWMVTLREGEGQGVAKPEILDLAGLLYDSCLTMYTDQGIGARRYNIDTPVSDDQWIMRNRLVGHYNVASLVLEVPNHWHYDPPAPYVPQPSWQARMTSLCFHHVVNMVHTNLQAFLDAKAASPAPPTTGTAYRWAGLAQQAVSKKYEHGEEVAQNLFRNPSFETGIDGIGTGSATEATPTTFASAIVSGSQAVSATITAAGTGSGQINQWTVDLDPSDAGKWIGYSFVARRSTGTTEAIAAYTSWGGSTDTHYVAWWTLDQIPNSDQPRRVIAVQIPAGATQGRLWLRASGSDTSQTPPSDGTIHTDTWMAVIADTEQDALDQAENGFDGDGPW